MLMIHTIMANIPDYPNYLISIDGDVISRTVEESYNNSRRFKPLVLKGDVNHGYKRVQLYNKEGSKRYRLHRLMLQVFIGAKDLLACHKNDDKQDNKLENLYWGTHSQNNNDAVVNNKIARTKTQPMDKGAKVSASRMLPFVKLYEKGERVSILVKLIHIEHGHYYNVKALSRKLRQLSKEDLTYGDRVRRGNKNKRDYNGLYTTR